jgi:hypothetical protein
MEVIIVVLGAIAYPYSALSYRLKLVQELFLINPNQSEVDTSVDPKK